MCGYLCHCRQVLSTPISTFRKGQRKISWGFLSTCFTFMAHRSFVELPPGDVKGILIKVSLKVYVQEVTAYLYKSGIRGENLETKTLKKTRRTKEQEQERKQKQEKTKTRTRKNKTLKKTKQEEKKDKNINNKTTTTKTSSGRRDTHRSGEYTVTFKIKYKATRKTQLHTSLTIRVRVRRPRSPPQMSAGRVLSSRYQSTSHFKYTKVHTTPPAPANNSGVF